MFGKKKKQQPEGYSYKPGPFDRDQTIAIQKIVSTVPVTRRLLPQQMLITALTNYVVKNVKIGSAAAKNVNTTKDPYLFFKSYNELISSTEELIKIEPYWRFEEMGPTQQLAEIAEKKDRIIKGFIYESFNEVVENIEKKRSPSAKQKLFDDYQNALLLNAETMGEENFDFFKQLCKEKLNISENDLPKNETPDEEDENEATGNSETTDEVSPESQDEKNS